MLDLGADWIFVIHGIFVVLAFPSAALALHGYFRNVPALWHLHNLSITVMVVGRLTLGRCPLVEVEEAMRNAAGTEMPYSGSYVGYVVDSLTGVTLPGGLVFTLSSLVALMTVAAALRDRRDTASQSLTQGAAG